MAESLPDVTDLERERVRRRSAASADADVSAKLAQVAQALAQNLDVEQMLQAILNLAAQLIPGCDHVALALNQAGRPAGQVVFTDDIAQKCDALRTELDEGPGSAVVTDAEPCGIPDTQVEDRWPRYAARVSALGVGSQLTLSLNSGRDAIGVLNLYSGTPHAFDGDSRATASGFAVHAAVAIAGAQREQHLRIAVESRQLIGQAVGMLMERHSMGAGPAFDLLVKASQRSSKKLRDVAARVVEAGPGALG
jgi:GAF domain-containing protein